MGVRGAWRHHNDSRQEQRNHATADLEPRAGAAQRLIGGAEHYPAAQRIQERLCTEGFPADRIMIIGRELTVAKHVPRGRSTVRAAVRGTGPGLLTGALVGWLSPLTGLVTEDVSAAWLTAVTAWAGAVLSALIAVLGYALSSPHRSNAAPVQAHRFVSPRTSRRAT
jgi:hypothetical protein